MSGLVLADEIINAESRLHSTCLPLPVPYGPTAWTFTRVTQSLASTDGCLHPSPQLVKYILSGDFIFIFSNLSLERSIQYLLDGHPRVCNTVGTHMMGFGWQSHFLLQ